MKMVLLSGKQGSGKTTLQKKLCEIWWKENKTGVVVVNFADILYQMHDAVLEVLGNYWPDRGLKKDGPLLQVLGTDWGRNTIDKDIWVKCLKARIIKMARPDVPVPGPELCIVGDCRFENEFDYFPDALKVRLICPEIYRRVRCEMWRENTAHPSETGLDEYEAAGKFDLYLHTDTNSVEDCVNLILLRLKRME